MSFRSRPALILLLFLLGLVLLASGWVLWTVRSAEAHLRQAEVLARELPRAGDPVTQIARVRVEIEAAQGDLESLTRPAGVLAPLRSLPLAGPYLDGYLRLLDGGQYGLRVAVRVLDWASPALAPSSTGDTTDRPTRFLRALAADREGVHLALADLRAAYAQLREISLNVLPTSLQQPFLTYLPLMQEADTLAATLDPALDPAFHALGFDQRRTYLLLLQNNLELRPTGGFIGSYGTLNLERGALDRLDIQDVYTFPLEETYKQGFPPAPQPLHDYLGANGFRFQDTNWSPDFPTSARTAAEYYQREFGHAPDGVIAVNFELMRRLLTALGPVQVAGIPEPVTADTLYNQYLTERRESEADANTGYKETFADLSRALLARARQANAGEMVPLVRAVGDSLTAKDILLYLPDPELGKMTASMNWDGAIRAASGDFLSINDANVSGFKISHYVEQSVDLYLSIAPDHTVRSTVVMSITNPITNTQRIFRRVYVPRGSQVQSLDVEWSDGVREIASVSAKWEASRLAALDLQDPDHYLLRRLANQPYALGDWGPKFGKLNLGIPLPVAKNGGRTVLRLAYQTPALVATRQGVEEYRLLLERQPGTLAIPIHLFATLPRGAQLVPGTTPWVQGSDGRWTTTLVLDRDREVVLRFR